MLSALSVAEFWRTDAARLAAIRRLRASWRCELSSERSRISGAGPFAGFFGTGGGALLSWSKQKVQDITQLLRTSLGKTGIGQQLEHAHFFFLNLRVVSSDLHTVNIYIYISLLFWLGYSKVAGGKKKGIPVNLRPRVRLNCRTSLSKGRMWVFKMPPAERLRLPAHLVWFSLEAPDSSGCQRWVRWQRQLRELCVPSKEARQRVQARLRV